MLDPNRTNSVFPHALGAGARNSNALKLVKPANMKELIEESRRKSCSVLCGSPVAFLQSQLDGFKRNLNELADTMTSQYEKQQSLIKSGAAVAASTPSLVRSLHVSTLKRNSGPSPHDSLERPEKKEVMKSDGVVRRMSLFKAPEKTRRDDKWA